MFDVTKDASYILKMRLGASGDAEYVQKETINLLNSMLNSPIGWRRGDMLQVIRNYYRVGLFEEGDAVKAYFRHMAPSTFSCPFDERDEGEHIRTKYYYEDKWHRYEEYRKLKDLFPDLTPNTATIYSSNRTKQSKSYLKLRSIAEAAGFVLEPLEPYHYCRRIQSPVEFVCKYDLLDARRPMIEYIDCKIHVNGKCDGHDDYGNLCIYPCMGSRPLQWVKAISRVDNLSMAVLLIHRHGSADVPFLQRIMNISENEAFMIQKKLLRLGIIENRYNSGHYGPRQTLEQTIIQYATIL